MVLTIEKLTIIPLIKLWVKKAAGLENLPRKGAAILAANHSSYADHLIIGSYVATKANRKFHFLAKKEYFQGIQKLWYVHEGAIPIDRQKGGKEALRLALRALRQDKLIVIYPVGTRSLTGKLQKAKTGVARLALQSKAPVIPIGLVGTFDILPKGKYLPRMKKAELNIGKPMRFPQHYDKKINKRRVNKVTVNIMKEIAKLSKQKYNFRH